MTQSLARQGYKGLRSLRGCQPPALPQPRTLRGSRLRERTDGTKIRGWAISGGRLAPADCPFHVVATQPPSPFDYQLGGPLNSPFLPTPTSCPHPSPELLKVTQSSIPPCTGPLAPLPASLGPRSSSTSTRESRHDSALSLSCISPSLA